MLDWTGERFVPWAKEAAVAYEHLHRYLWSSNFIEDKRVLDLASGEGYGGEILPRFLDLPSRRSEVHKLMHLFGGYLLTRRVVVVY